MTTTQTPFNKTELERKLDELEALTHASTVSVQEVDRLVAEVEHLTRKHAARLRHADYTKRIASGSLTRFQSVIDEETQGFRGIFLFNPAENGSCLCPACRTS